MDVLKKIFLSREKILPWIVLVLFVVLSFIVCRSHESFVDVAQSYLIARDTSFLELIKIMPYEGSPFLWPLLLKIPIFLGLKYHQIWLLGWFISSISVYWILFKSDYPFIIRLLTPFTFWIFYQYTAIVRSYSLILPFIAIISKKFPKRFDNPISYSIVLALFACLSAHTFCLAASLYLCFILEHLKSCRKNFISYKRINLCILFLFFYFLLIAFYMMTPADANFGQANKNNFRLEAIRNFNLIQYLYDNSYLLGLIRSYYIPTFLRIIFIPFNIDIIELRYALAIILLICLKFKPQFLLISLTIPAFIFYIYGDFHHYGLVFYGYLLAGSLYPPKSRSLLIKENLINLKYNAHLAICICLLFSINACVNTSIFELNNAYSGAKEAANFIKENKFIEKGKSIYTCGFFPMHVSAYFEKQLYTNLPQEYAFYWWSEKYFTQSIESILDDEPDIWISSDFPSNKKIAKYYSTIDSTLHQRKYKHISFNGKRMANNRQMNYEVINMYIKPSVVKEIIKNKSQSSKQ